MPNTIPAAGEAMPNDILPSIERYIAAEQVLNATQVPIEGTSVGAEFEAAIEAIMDGKLRAFTFHGAMKAIRLAQAEIATSDSAGSMVEPLLKGAMAYFDRLEGRDSRGERSLAEKLLSFDMTTISSDGWSAVYHALTIVIHSLEGISCQPRCGDGKGFNAAGKYLEALEVFAVLSRRRLVDAAAAARPDNEHDWDARDAVLMLDRVAGGIDSNLKEIGEFALELHAQRAEHFGERRTGAAVETGEN